MDKKFECTMVAETKEGFSLSFAMVNADGQQNLVRGNINLNGLTKTEAAAFKVGNFYQLTEVQ